MKTTDSLLPTKDMLFKTADGLLKTVDNRKCKLKTIANQTSLFIQCCEATGA